MRPISTRQMLWMAHLAVARSARRQADRRRPTAPPQGQKDAVRNSCEPEYPRPMLPGNDLRLTSTSLRNQS